MIHMFKGSTASEMARQSKMSSSVHTLSVAAAAEGAGYVQVVRQQEQCSQQLLHSHHGLQEVLQVHVCHLGRLRAGDGIMMLDLKTT